MRCVCEVDYDEPVECVTHKIVKARKDHKCCECNLDINKGSKYEVASGIFDHSPFKMKTCLTCVAIWNDRFIGRLYTHSGQGLLNEELHECIGIGINELPDECEHDEIDEEDAMHIEREKRRNDILREV